MRNYGDTMTQEGARDLAASVAAFWHRKGHSHVKVWTEQVATGRVFVYCVRSNLINGMPPRARLVRR